MSQINQTLAGNSEVSENLEPNTYHEEQEKGFLTLVSRILSSEQLWPPGSPYQSHGVTVSGNFSILIWIPVGRERTHTGKRWNWSVSDTV